MRSTPTKVSGTPVEMAPPIWLSAAVQGGLLPVPPMDKLQDLRSEIVLESRSGHQDRGPPP